jgi:hypothetical protein
VQDLVQVHLLKPCPDILARQLAQDTRDFLSVSNLLWPCS